jgi:hypothetical protein
MSVILYSREEIVTALAASWNRGSIGSTDNIRYMDYLAEAGNRIMAANRQAWDATYEDKAEQEIDINGRSIKAQLIRDTAQSKLDGLRTLRGLRYNLIANNGQDFATTEILDDLLGMFQALYDKLEARRAA